VTSSSSDLNFGFLEEEIQIFLFVCAIITGGIVFSGHTAHGANPRLDTSGSADHSAHSFRHDRYFYGTAP